MKERPLKIGDLVQLHGDLPSPLAGMIGTVHESKSFGAVVAIPNAEDTGAVTVDGVAYIRLDFSDFEILDDPN